MAKGVMAIFYLYSSTEENPQNQYCPKCDPSWIKFQVGECKGIYTYRPVKDPIPNAVKKVILPVFEKLENQKFLKCCKNNMSAEPNEA